MRRPAPKASRPANDAIETTKTEIQLRDVRDTGLPVLFDFGRDPDAVRMAAFTPTEPSDRAAFKARWAKILDSPDTVARTILADGEVAGSVLVWRDEALDGPEVSYWIDPRQWGRGIASRALGLILAEVAIRPLFGRAAEDNVASLRVLEKAGFKRVGQERGFANGRDEEITAAITKLGE